MYERGLQLQVSDEGSVTRLSLGGELDLDGVGAIERTIRRLLPESSDVVVDLERLRFIDSTGIRMLLEIKRSFTARGSDVAFTPGGPQVQRVFAVSGVERVLGTLEAGPA